MYRRIALSLVVLALAGCAAPLNISRPPESQVRVDETYVADPDLEPRLAIVLGPVAVTDGGVAKHIGGTPEDSDATYLAFFSDQLPARLFRDAHVRDVRVLDPGAYDRAGTGPRPADGARLTFGEFDADLVLLLDTLHVGRASYLTFSQTGPGTKEMLRLDTDVVLWDNRAGREAASGRLETQRGLSSIPGRGMYEAAVGEFVEQLARYTPVDLRRERRRPSGGGR